MAFIEASVFHASSLADMHGLHPDDIERHKLHVVAALLGDSGTSTLSTALGRSGLHWARKIVAVIPMRAVNNLSRVLGPVLADMITTLDRFTDGDIRVSHGHVERQVEPSP